MSPPTLRRFTLVDAMLLVAAVGLSFFPVREYLQYAADVRTVQRFLGTRLEWSLACFWRVGTLMSGVLAPLAAAVSVVLWGIRFLRPRPPLQCMFRQPGTVACTAVVVETILMGLKYVLAEVGWSPRRWLFSPIHALISRLPGNGEAVAIAWIVLWLSGSWRPESSGSIARGVPSGSAGLSVAYSSITRSTIEEPPGGRFLLGGPWNRTLHPVLTEREAESDARYRAQP